MIAVSPIGSCIAASNGIEDLKCKNIPPCCCAASLPTRGRVVGVKFGKFRNLTIAVTTGATILPSPLWGGTERSDGEGPLKQKYEV